MGHLAEGRRSSRILAAAAVLLAVMGVVAVVVALRDQAVAPPQPPTASAPDEPKDDRRPAAPARPQGGRNGERKSAGGVEALDFSAPVQIRIPSIDVSSELVDLGLDEAGAMETPVPVTRAGWFRPSPPPGVPGATVIAGHVTWDQEPTVFFELGSLKAGDTIQVEREDGAVTTFEVYRTGSFPKDSFPTEAVYDQPDRSELRLITCGGEYDEDANRYLDNVIVWAKIVDVQRT